MVVKTKGIGAICLLSPGMFTEQLFSTPHNHAVTGVLLTNAPKHFHTQVTLTMRGTVLAGSCLLLHKTCIQLLFCRHVFPQRFMQIHTYKDNTLAVAEAGHHLRKPCDQQLNWVWLPRLTLGCFCNILRDILLLSLLPIRASRRVARSQQRNNVRDRH